MATILPGSPPTFNKNDVEGTVKSLCNYTRSLQENIDFLLGQLQKRMSDAEGDITGLTTQCSSLQTTLTSVQSSVSSLSGSITSLSARVTALEQKVNNTN